MNFFISRITKHLAVGFVLISAVVMGYIMFELENTKKHFANQLIEQSSELVYSELDNFFVTIEDMILTLKRHHEDQLMNSTDLEWANKYFIPIIDQYPQISSFGIADSRGFEIDVLPDTLSDQWVNREVHVDEWGMIEKWYRWSVYDSLSLIESWESELIVDPRDREWFKGVKNEKDGVVYWTEPYEYMTGDLGITASIKWSANPEDTLTHILALDITLNDVTDFSQGLNITENNQVFILTGNKNIIGLPQENKSLNPDSMEYKYLFTPAEFGNRPLISLMELSNDEILSFKYDDETWWGFVEPYPITDKQQLLIAILIPENDFAAEINGTKKAMVAGFFVIILLASLVVRSHNRLRKAKISLNEQNDIITQQKERLFAEVHHRVKNNLAVMSALIELENMESEEKAIKEILTQTQRRIKSMSAVHEIMYKTDDLNQVQITDFIPTILNFSKKSFDEINIELKQNIGDVLINVNQALTYALLINEFMNSILKARLDLKDPITVEVLKQDAKMITIIKIDANVDYLKARDGVGKQLIEVLIAQLGADLNAEIEKDFTEYRISFELKDIRGITSNYRYSS